MENPPSFLRKFTLKHRVTIIDPNAQDAMVADVFPLWPEWQVKYGKRWSTAEGAHTEGEQGVSERYALSRISRMDGSSLTVRSSASMKAAAAAAVSASGKSTFIDVVVGLQPIKSEDFPYFPINDTFPINDSDVHKQRRLREGPACSSPKTSKASES